MRSEYVDLVGKQKRFRSRVEKRVACEEAAQYAKASDEGDAATHLAGCQRC